MAERRYNTVFVFDHPTHTIIIIIINIVKMQMLVGTYQCTGVPGEFEWKPGILTRVSIYDNTNIVRICGTYMCTVCTVYPY